MTGEAIISMICHLMTPNARRHIGKMSIINIFTNCNSGVTAIAASRNIDMFGMGKFGNVGRNPWKFNRILWILVADSALLLFIVTIVAGLLTRQEIVGRQCALFCVMAVRTACPDFLGV